MNSSLAPAIRLRPRRFTGNEAQARSLIAQRAVGRPVKLAGGEWSLTLEPVLEAPPLGESDWRIEAQWAGAPFVLGLPASAARTWIAARFPDLDLPPLPSSLVSATLEEALSEALETLRALGRGAAQIDRVASSTTQDRAPLAHRFTLTLAGNEQVIHASLATDSLGLMLTAGLFSAFPPCANGLGEEAQPITLRAEIGRSVLAAGLLGSLSPRDLILIDHSWVGQSGELWLGCGEQGLRVRCDDTQLTVTQAFSRIGLNMPDTEAVTPDAVPASVDSIPVQIVFDLGERTLTLGELKALQPGQTLDLGKPLATAVNIRANGALIGYGELVEIDGRLGVSVAVLAEKPA